MKRAIYLDEVDIDLLECSLALWIHRLESAETSSAGLHGHYYAKVFTQHRIAAMQLRLKDLSKKEKLPDIVKKEKTT